ncbi:MAG TPA: penicillin-binding protein 2 [Acidimicrobiales bacterium]|nr:penicillin-binding protein 2 [Acidimicrobiales bacterium]
MLLSTMFLVIVVRLAYVQVVSPGRYVAYGDAQRIQPIEVAGGRGAIYDRNGEDLAISVPLSSIAVDPSIIDAPATTAARLSPILGIEVSELRARLSENVRFVWLARQVEDNVADAVRELDIPGVILFDEQSRFTPSGDLATSLLGTVDRDSTGVSGIELAYEELLSGESGRLVVERDLQGRTIPAGRHHIDPARPGHDLILTVDGALQYEVENVLQEYVTAAGARGGIAIVSNPETGEVLALANQQRDEATGVVHNTGNNLAVTQNYEPGSVNKVITVAAALEEGLVTPEQVISVPSSLRVADHTYEDAHPGNLTVTDIVAQSSNVGTIKLAQELGGERLDEYLRRFGFGRDTGLGLPHEENGQMLPLENWSGTSIGSIPLGQGIGVTAMQMLFAYNVLANDGVYVPPSLVAATRDAEGERHPVAPEDSRRVVSPTTAAQLRAMLTEVIDQGTGEAADIEGYDVAGKTGTARKPQPEGGGYENPDGSYDYIATFAGFLPADDPKLSIIVVIDEPANGYYASEVAAPAFAEIGRRAARTMAVAPSLPEEQAPLAISTADGRVRATPAAPPTTVPPPTTAPLPTAPTTVAPGTATTAVPPAGGDPDAAAAAGAAAGTGPPTGPPGG